MKASEYCHVAQKPKHHKKAALTRVAYSKKLTGIQLYIYKCPFCNKYHLTRSQQD